MLQIAGRKQGGRGGSPVFRPSADIGGFPPNTEGGSRAEAGRKGRLQKKEAKKSAPARPLVRALARIAKPVPISVKMENRKGTNMKDLTKLLRPTDGLSEPQVDHGIKVPNADVEVVFRNHRDRLLEEIERYPTVVGCVAWLTDTAVLEVLRTRKFVSIVVQKEDFLKPDTAGSNRRLRKLYDAIPSISRYSLPQIGGFNYCGDPSSEAIRCVGNHNYDRRPAFPRMHNKFLVFCDRIPHPHAPEEWVLTPVKAWTGSYNISDNASRSWENAIIIDNRDVATAYAEEFGQIFGFSEPLDWTSTWSAPTYRIGS